MADNEQRQVSIQKIYLRDQSFESPHAPEIFTAEMKGQPKVNMNIASKAKNLGGDAFEVSLKINVEVTHEDKTLYLAEVEQGGLFTAAGFGDEERGQIIGIWAPTQLFPYAREAISDAVAKGGFPPMLLAPVNFEALYVQQQQQAAAQH